VQVIAPVAQHAQGGAAALGDLVRRSFLFLQEGYAWWRVEVRRNRAVQYGTVAVLAAVILFSYWFYQRRSATPLQKLQRRLGF
jgi:hypothetical protein